MFIIQTTIFLGSANAWVSERVLFPYPLFTQRVAGSHPPLGCFELQQCMQGTQPLIVNRHGAKQGSWSLCYWQIEGGGKGRAVNHSPKIVPEVQEQQRVPSAPALAHFRERGKAREGVFPLEGFSRANSVGAVIFFFLTQMKEILRSAFSLLQVGLSQAIAKGILFSSPHLQFALGLAGMWESAHWFTCKKPKKTFR